MKFFYLYKYLILLICTQSCGIYSFTGASIPLGAETVSIEYFPNKATTIQASLSQVFTEKLRDQFIEQTNLNLNNKGGDLTFNGYIKKYEIKPISIKSNETASQNRLTISVHVVYKNNINPKTNFEQTFSRYKDFQSSINITDIEEDLIDEITTQLIEDIFNKSIVNW